MMDTIWEAGDTERPDVSNKFLIGILSLKSAYSESDRELIFDSLAYLIVEAQYELVDAEREYTYTRNV